jgi:Peptidase_C39 like family
METALTSFGLTFQGIRNGTDNNAIDQIQNALLAGRPVITWLNGYHLQRNYLGHFVVVTAISADGQTVTINDPDTMVAVGIKGGPGVQLPRATFAAAMHAVDGSIWSDIVMGGADRGGVDLNGYCSSIGYVGVQLTGTTAYGWACFTSTGTLAGIYMPAACQWYDHNPSETAGFLDYYDKYSWHCYDYLAPPQLIAPTAPANQGAWSQDSSHIAVSWTNIGPVVDSNSVQRLSGAGWSEIALLGPTATSYQDANLSAATTYVYRVCASNTVGVGCPSGSVSATTQPSTQPPQAPANQRATALDSSRIQITWTDSSVVSYFYVNRWNGTTWIRIGSTTSTTMSYIDTGLAAATFYSYYVCAVNANLSACAQTAVATTTLSPPQPPTAPSNVQVQPTSPTTLYMTWTNNASSALGIRIWDGGTLLDTVGTSATADWIYDLQPGSYNCLRVEAYNAAGSSFSNWACTTMPQNVLPIPGGNWINPTQNGLSYSGSVLLMANASAASGRSVNHVTFTASVAGGPWFTVCRVFTPNSPNTYQCNFNISQFASGIVTVSFDVYDNAGTVNYAPNGTHFFYH